MDADIATRFIASLTKSLQAVIHGCLDFEKDIELGGYVYLKVDSAERIDYVLSEKMQKSDLNSTTFHSNSYHALPQPGSSGSKESRDRHISASSSEPAGRSAGSGRVLLESDSESPMYSATHSAASSKMMHQNLPPSLAQNSDSFMYPKSSCSSEFQVSAGSVKLPLSSNKGSAVGMSEGFGSNNRSLTDFQTAFRNPSASLGSELKQSSSAHNWTSSHNGSNSRSSASHTVQQQQNKSSILPDPSDMEVIHIKTEEEEDVFNIPLQCHQGGSESGPKADLFQSLSDPQLSTSGVGVSALPGVATSTSTAPYMSAEGTLGWMDSHLPPISSCQSKVDPIDTFQLQTLMQQNNANSSFLSSPSQMPRTLPRVSEALSSELLTDTQMVTCSICGYVSSSKKSLARHASLRHFRQGDFACGECGKVFQTKLYLNQHMKSHGERKFMCEVCGQKFLYKHHLPRHQQAVHGVVTCYGVPPQVEESRDDLSLVFEKPS